MTNARSRFIAFTVVALAFVSVIAVRAADKTPDAKPASGGTRYFEMRKYYAAEGKLDALNARFRDHTVALFEKHGMDIVGFWVPIEGDEANKVLIYLLAYPDKAARDASWEAFKNDPAWTKAHAESEKDGKLVGKIESTFMSATDYSAIK